MRETLQEKLDQGWVIEKEDPRGGENKVVVCRSCESPQEMFDLWEQWKNDVA